MKKIKKLYVDGFLLIEAAIAIIVIGLISTMLLQFIKLSIKLQNDSVTKNIISEIKSTLVAFIKMNKYVPLPLFKDKEQFDISNIKGKVIIGTVPYGVLGLTKNDTYDGNGRSIVYCIGCKKYDYYSENPVQESFTIPIAQKSLGLALSAFSLNVCNHSEDDIGCLLISSSQADKLFASQYVDDIYIDDCKSHIACITVKKLNYMRKEDQQIPSPQKSSVSSKDMYIASLLKGKSQKK